jgi:hypothetical protein
MQRELKTLEGLVKRRGQTNDPTEEIGICTERLQADIKELIDSCLPRIVPPSARGHSRKHYEHVASWIKVAAQQQGARLQRILKTRAQVLSEQAQRRKLFAASGSTSMALPATAAASFTAPSSVAGLVGTSSAAASTSSFSSSAALSRANNPLFTLPAPRAADTARRTPSQPPLLQPNGAAHSTQTVAGYGGSRPTTGSTVGVSGKYYYGGSGGTTTDSYQSHYDGYGSSSNSSSSGGGLRQRRHLQLQQHDENNRQHERHFEEQERLQVLVQERQARQRLEEARQAESSLAELGTLFGKMSQLVSSQGETLSKIEDDVESALLDVQSGHGEIQQLYGIKKGNRAFILKTFGLLIFFIVFMRLYKSK